MNTTDYREWSSRTVRVAADGTVTYGIEVPHEGANLQCNEPLGERKDFESGVTYTVRCKKRAGHETPKGEQQHHPVDTRFVASPPRVSRSRRFMPNSVPKGVDMSITMPHDCANHLD